MNITGNITGIKYKIFLADSLKEVDINSFDINEVPTSCLLKDNYFNFAISKWVSPKRTRSYPFERVYNTLSNSKRITVIPIVKDEGEKGDRDFLQWDTISLMSLLDVYVIFAYYESAVKSNQKISNQKFNNNYIISKIKEIEQYHSSALHWNLNEINTQLHFLIDKVKDSYSIIENKTGVKLHNPIGLDNFKHRIGEDVSLFMAFSRGKAEKAQYREFITIQPKESLSTLTKAKITITNYLGGQYFLTVDEVKLTNKKVILIESKHSRKSIIPSKSDIKDGLLKMILYSNLINVSLNRIKLESEAVLCLTSSKLIGEISSKNPEKEIINFFDLNKFSKTQINLINTIFTEANSNNFIIYLQNSK